MKLRNALVNKNSFGADFWAAIIHGNKARFLIYVCCCGGSLHCGIFWLKMLVSYTVTGLGVSDIRNESLSNNRKFPCLFNAQGWFFILFYVPDHDRPSRPFEGAKKNTLYHNIVPYHNKQVNKFTSLWKILMAGAWLKDVNPFIRHKLPSVPLSICINLVKQHFKVLSVMLRDLEEITSENTKRLSITSWCCTHSQLLLLVRLHIS